VVVYRLLTVGSVEIDMMKKQLSKKKLERLTIHGGDFRKAGHRGTGVERKSISLEDLRRLLEDDVKVDRKEREKDKKQHNTDKENTENSQEEENDSNNEDTKAKLTKDISDSELEVILDRFHMFSGAQSSHSNHKEPRSSLSLLSPSKDDKKKSPNKNKKNKKETNEEEEKKTEPFPLEGDMYDFVNMGIDDVLQNLD
jgi:hypothetical protein